MTTMTLVNNKYIQKYIYLYRVKTFSPLRTRCSFYVIIHTHLTLGGSITSEILKIDVNIVLYTTDVQYTDRATLNRQNKRRR